MVNGLADDTGCGVLRRGVVRDTVVEKSITLYSTKQRAPRALAINPHPNPKNPSHHHDPVEKIPTPG